MSTQKNFLFNTQWAEAVKNCEPELRLEVYEAVISYATTGSTGNLSPMAQMAFHFIRTEMDYNREQYENTIEKRREAGRRGAAATNGKSRQSAAKTADAGCDVSEPSKPAVNVNANENENKNKNDDVNEEKEKIDRKEFFETKGLSADEIRGLEMEFEAFRQEYHGQKRGAEASLKDFRDRYPDTWMQIVPLLRPALAKLKEWERQARKEGSFVPAPKHMSRWLCERCWEEEYAQLKERRPVDPYVEQCRREKEELRQREKQEEIEFERLRTRYASRVPHAFTDDAPMEFVHYRYMGYDSVPDNILNRDIELIQSGQKKLPEDIREMLSSGYNPVRA